MEQEGVTIMDYIYAAILVCLNALPGIALVYGAYRLVSVSDKKSFDSYRKAHKGFVKDGRVRCYVCGGGSIYLRTSSFTPFTLKSSHVCRGCGTELYQSIT